MFKNTDDWYRGMDLGNYIGTISVDQKKAFDTVDHDILLQKPDHYGAQELDLILFESYLSDRKQFTRINGADSITQKIYIKVSQGACLSPLLILIFTNDLPYSIKNAEISTYADDASLALQSEKYLS